MPLTWQEAVTADKVEVKESHIEELREGIDTTYDYAVDIDNRLGVLKGRVDQHIGSTGLSNHGAASTAVSGFMTPTMVSQLQALAAYLNPDGTLNIKTEITNIVNNPTVPSTSTLSGFLIVPSLGHSRYDEMPDEYGWGDNPSKYGWSGMHVNYGAARLPVPAGFTKEQCTYQIDIMSIPHDDGGTTDQGWENYSEATWHITDNTLVSWYYYKSVRYPFKLQFMCTATR